MIRSFVIIEYNTNNCKTFCKYRYFALLTIKAIYKGIPKKIMVYL